MAKAAKPTNPPLWDQSWTRFAGLYRSPYDDGITQVVLLNNQLVLLATSATAAETKTVLEPLGEGRFRLMAPTGGGAVGEVVRFDETPRPTGVALSWRHLVGARQRVLTPADRIKRLSSRAGWSGLQNRHR
jgi:hypothetical protein